MWLMYQITHNYAWSIVLFTLITRILLFPLSVKQQKSTAAMSAFQPKLERLKRNSPDILSLFWLPLLIQFPILYGIFDVVYRPISHIIRAGDEVVLKATEICRNIFTQNGGTVPAYFNARPEIYIVKEIQNNPAAFEELNNPDFVNAVSEFNNKLFGLVDLGDIPTIHPEQWNAAAGVLLM